jgi:hypothetical protein
VLSATGEVERRREEAYLASSLLGAGHLESSSCGKVGKEVVELVVVGERVGKRMRKVERPSWCL